MLELGAPPACFQRFDTSYLPPLYSYPPEGGLNPALGVGKVEEAQGDLLNTPSDQGPQDELPLGKSPAYFS